LEDSLVVEWALKTGRLEGLLVVAWTLQAGRLEGLLVVVWALQAGRLEGLLAVVRTLKAFNPASCLNPILRLRHRASLVKHLNPVNPGLELLLAWRLLAVVRTASRKVVRRKIFPLEGLRERLAAAEWAAYHKAVLWDKMSATTSQG
jgi:hypothetical protein